jgi:hypothetical protein
VITEEDKGTTVAVKFCDATIHEETYDPTAWGNISAVEAYNKYVKQANDNHTVFAKIPHILNVEMSGKEQSCSERFTCTCSRQAVPA